MLAPNNAMNAFALLPRFQNAAAARHGHSQSLAAGPVFYNPLSAFNPFGPHATLGSDQIVARKSAGASPDLAASAAAPREFAPTPPRVGFNVQAPVFAPQGRVLAGFGASLGVPSPAPPMSRPESRPDFARGFGLDIPEEEEPPEEEEEQTETVRREAEEAAMEAGAEADVEADAEAEAEAEAEADVVQEIEVPPAISVARDFAQEFAEAGADQDGLGGFGMNERFADSIPEDVEAEEMGIRTAQQSRVHSRHVSKLSAALSLRSVGGVDGGFVVRNGPSEMEVIRDGDTEAGEGEREERDTDAAAEWTGSEDMRMDGESDDEVRLSYRQLPFTFLPHVLARSYFIPRFHLLITSYALPALLSLVTSAWC
jgi:hypothetical protein